MCLKLIPMLYGWNPCLNFMNWCFKLLWYFCRSGNLLCSRYLLLSRIPKYTFDLFGKLLMSWTKGLKLITAQEIFCFLSLLLFFFLCETMGICCSFVSKFALVHRDLFQKLRTLEKLHFVFAEFLWLFFFFTFFPFQKPRRKIASFAKSSGSKFFGEKFGRCVQLIHQPLLRIFWSILLDQICSKIYNMRTFYPPLAWKKNEKTI